MRILREEILRMLDYDHVRFKRLSELLDFGFNRAKVKLAVDLLHFLEDEELL